MNAHILEAYEYIAYNVGVIAAYDFEQAIDAMNGGDLNASRAHLSSLQAQCFSAAVPEPPAISDLISMLEDKRAREEDGKLGHWIQEARTFTRDKRVAYTKAVELLADVVRTEAVRNRCGMQFDTMQVIKRRLKEALAIVEPVAEKEKDLFERKKTSIAQLPFPRTASDIWREAVKARQPKD